MIFDMSQMTEGSPSVFVKRDWLNIQDQQNGNYGGNQLVIDTSQLANSNKYMAYREAYLSIPLVLAASCPITTVTGIATITLAVGSAVTGSDIIELPNALAQCYLGCLIGDKSGSTGTAIFGTSVTRKILSISLDGKTIRIDGVAEADSDGTTELSIAADQDAGSTFMKDLQGSSVDGTPGGVAQTFTLGLKSWFGNLIHSMTLDYAGTTVIQQTPWQSMWTTFGLMTTLGLSDLELNASTIGFYPDVANSWSFQGAASASGEGTCNNVNAGMLFSQADPSTGAKSGNSGMIQRQTKTWIHPATIAGGQASSGQAKQYKDLLSINSMDQLYRSRVHSTYRSATDASIVYQIQAQIMLKHLHPFFSQVPLLKGVFFRLTLNLNQPEFVLSRSTANAVSISTIISPLGGIVPVIVGSSVDNSSSSLLTIPTNQTSFQDKVALLPAGKYGFNQQPTTAQTMRVTLNVGNSIISQTQQNAIGAVTTNLNRSCFLYVPSFTFNPSFEEAYLSRPTKNIVYTDIYQFTTTEVGPSGQFNFLLTNGISNVKSVLILPFFKQIKTDNELGAVGSVTYPVYQSPFDPAGTGPVSPMVSLRNFNVVVAGQNMIYNTQQYNFEQFLNQLVGVNSVNANLTDGLTSGLIDFMAWQQSYGYYYVNCARMLPIDEAVPKSISIQGTNSSAGTIQFLTFIEYGVQVSVDVLTGARV